LSEDVRSDDAGRPYLSLIIPAYNEDARVGSALETVEDYLNSTSYTYEIIAVDDGSSDNTREILLDCAARISSMRVVSYSPNQGKGYAVRQGVFAARGDYVAFSDADLSAPIDEMPKLLEAIHRGYDVAIGSRATRGSQLVVHQPRFRELGGRGLNLIIRALAVPGIHDTQCGFKLFTAEAAREVFSRSFVNGWGFDVELLYLARRFGYSVAEVPIRWAHAEGSKVRPFRAAVRIIRDVLAMRFHNYGNQRP